MLESLAAELVEGGSHGYRGPTACEMQAFPWAWAVFSKMGWRGKVRLDHIRRKPAHRPPTVTWQKGKQASTRSEQKDTCPTDAPPDPGERRSGKAGPHPAEKPEEREGPSSPRTEPGRRRPQRSRGPHAARFPRRGSGKMQLLVAAHVLGKVPPPTQFLNIETRAYKMVF